MCDSDMFSMRSAMRLYIVFLFLRLFYLEPPAPLQFLELYSGGVRPMVGALPATRFYVSDIIFLAHACFSIPGVLAGARLRPARPLSLFAIELHALMMNFF